LDVVDVMRTSPLCEKLFLFLAFFPGLAFARGPQAPETVAVEAQRVTLEGLVLDVDGSLAADAEVTSSSGGKARTDSTGRFRLEVEVPPGATSVELIGRGGGGATARTQVALGAGPGNLWVDPLALVQGAPGSPRWIPTFGAQPGTDDDVKALIVHDDGSGPALYAGGSFLSAGGTQTEAIARWDGSTWSPLGDGLPGEVVALELHDDGSGLALFAGGTFPIGGLGSLGGVAKWDGTSWTALGLGANKTRALKSFDDGSGLGLFVGGDFLFAGGAPRNHIAKWNGSIWLALGTGANGAVNALTVFDDGSGPALYAGGQFTTTGGIATSRVAKWDGTSWSPLGSGVDGTVYCLEVFDDGNGPALYAGGSFTTAGGVAAKNVARWDGSTWSNVGAGILSFNGVQCLEAFDDGGGADLYAGGDFTGFSMRRWNGTTWSGFIAGATDGNVSCLAEFDEGDGPRIFVGGRFTQAPPLRASRILRYDGTSFSALQENERSGLNDEVYALTEHDDGSGPALYAGGLFTSAGGAKAQGLAKWDGSGWTEIGGGIGFTPTALAAYDAGGGSALYIGTVGVSGPFYRWDGSALTMLEVANRGILTLAVYDDGGGPLLYAGGGFGSVGSVSANRIAAWDGTTWSAVGGGANGDILALVVHDDGTGPALFAGGDFSTAGGAPASRVAKWDGTSWSPLGTGTNDTVRALTVFDDGTGPALYVAGDFTTAGGVSARSIARWDGANWSSLGTSLRPIHVLAVHDDGNGAELFAGGEFTSIGGVTATRIAKWNGSTWAPLGSGVGDTVRALASFDLGDQRVLCAGGLFGGAHDSHDSYVAVWGHDVTPPVLDCPAVTVLDVLGSAPGEVVHFAPVATDDTDPAPSVVCFPPSGSFFPRGTTLVTCTATDLAGNESVCEFPVTVVLKARKR